MSHRAFPPIQQIINDMYQACMKAYVDDALHQQLIKDAAEEMRALRTVTRTGGSFMAGTYARADARAGPDRNIKVDHQVLSQPEEAKEATHLDRLPG